jgi:hypothetical protein
VLSTYVMASLPTPECHKYRAAPPLPRQFSQIVWRRKSSSSSSSWRHCAARIRWEGGCELTCGQWRRGQGIMIYGTQHGANANIIQDDRGAPMLCRYSPMFSSLAQSRTVRPELHHSAWVGAQQHTRARQAELPHLSLAVMSALAWTSNLAFSILPISAAQ